MPVFITIGNETINIVAVVRVLHDTVDSEGHRVTTVVLVDEQKGRGGGHRSYPYDSKAAVAIRKWFMTNSTVLAL